MPLNNVQKLSLYFFQTAKDLEKEGIEPIDIVQSAKNITMTNRENNLATQFVIDETDPKIIRLITEHQSLRRKIIEQQNISTEAFDQEFNDTGFKYYPETAKKFALAMQKITRQEP